MEGFWQSMPSSGGRGSSWYWHEKSDNSKYSRADRFLEDVDPGHQNRQRHGPAFYRHNPFSACSSVGIIVGFSAPAMPSGPVFAQSRLSRRNETRVFQELNALAREHGCPHRPNAICSAVDLQFDEICELAQEIPADVIVMPTHGRTGLKHVFLGSTAETHGAAFALSSICHVRKQLVNRRTRRVLRLTRFWSRWISPIARGKRLQYAIGFANEFGAKIILLHATYLGYIYSSEGTAVYDIPGLQKAARKNAERQMRELVQSAKFRGVKFEIAFTGGLASLGYLRRSQKTTTSI